MIASKNDTVDLYLDLMKNTLTASIYDESAWRVVRITKPVGRPRWNNAGQRQPLLVVEPKAMDPAVRENGKDWPMFGFTMAGHRRLDNVRHCVESVLREEVPGDFVETGAWRGGTTIFFRALLKAYGVSDRSVWVADSFEGMPVSEGERDGPDLSKSVYLKVSLDNVKSNFNRFGLLDNQVRFLKGWFCDTLPTAPIERIAVLRLDGDMYSSTMDALDNLYHKVSEGGYVIVDDYYSWDSCHQAVSDFLTNNGIQARIEQIDWSGAYWRV